MVPAHVPRISFPALNFFVRRPMSASPSLFQMTLPQFWSLPTAAWISIVALTALPHAGAQTPTPDFHADVAPILRDYCLGCHAGKDAEGGFRLETFALLKKGAESGDVLNPRDGKSALLTSVMRGEKPAMPPKKEPQPTEADIQIVEAWIAAGAPGPKAQDVPLQSLLNIPSIPLAVRESKAITALAYAPDGRRFARGRYRTVEVLETGTRKLLHKFEGLEGKVCALQFSPDGTMLAATTGVPGVRGSLVQWRLEGDSKRVDFPVQHRDLIYALQWSPDGKLIATGGYDSTIILWDAAGRRPLRTLSGHNGAVFAVAFHPGNALLASASADQTVKVWRLRDGVRLDTLKEPQGEQTSVAFSADGTRILAAGADNRVRMWELKSTEKESINPLLETRYAHEAAITGFLIHPDGTRMLTVSRDKTPKLWSLPALDVLRVLPVLQDTPTAAAFDSREQEAVLALADGSVERVGFSVPQTAVALSKESDAPAQAAQVAHMRAALAPPTPVTKSAEIEPNDTPEQATPLPLPAEVKGAIARPGDADLYRFESRKGQKWIFEIHAARGGSPLDSKLEVLTAEGHPIERTVLQSMRSSWLAFRGRDSNTATDFRIQHGNEAELNEYLYCDGEVSRLWGYPNGPDSGFTLYPGYDTRHTFFGTTACAHALGAPLYIVRPLPAGSKPAPNGLPLFRLFYENDDDPSRSRGKDSFLDFTAPSDGSFLLRVTDTRGFGDGKSLYTLHARAPKPDFSVRVPSGKPIAISPGSGKDVEITLERVDGFEGAVRVEITGLPPGFHASPQVTVDAGQQRAYAAIWADADARSPEKDAAKAAKIVARARIGERDIFHETALSELALGAAPKVLVHIAPETHPAPGNSAAPLELTIRPGETIHARAVAKRVDFKQRIEFGRAESCRNLPHGVFVDNVGLNGLLIGEGETERSFAITAAKWVLPSSRWVFLACKSDGGHTSQPILLHVRP